MEKQKIKSYIIVLLSVFVFEVCTGGLWINKNMSNWAFLYGDISWILTLGWTAIIMISTLIIEKVIKKSEKLRFFLILFLSSLSGIIGESYVLGVKIREYSPDVTSRLSGINIPFVNVPVEALYYIPVFMILIICTARYWNRMELKI